MSAACNSAAGAGGNSVSSEVRSGAGLSVMAPAVPNCHSGVLVTHAKRHGAWRMAVLSASVSASLLVGCVNLAPTAAKPASNMVPATVGGALPPAQTLEQTGDVLAQQVQPMLASLQWVQAQSLRDVMALALVNSRDLRVALANIEKARAQYGVQQADRWPTVAATVQGTRSQQADDLTTTRNGLITNQITAQLAATSYELDLWGRVRNLNEAALQQFLQVQANRRSVELVLVTDVANAWLTLAADQARLDLAKSTLASREKAYALTVRMFKLGATNGLVLAQNRSTVDTARADVGSYTAQVERDRNALQLLVGGAVPDALLPGAMSPLLQADEQAPTALAPVSGALPSSVLLARPDVQAAEYALRAMTANIGAARAAMFPTITLTASVGTGSNELSGLFANGNGIWSFVPQVRLPIFDAGRNRANVQIAQANEQVALAQYEKAIQTAFREVRDALADRATWQERLDAQRSMVSSTQTALDLSQARFKSGVDNYLSVLDAQRSLYTAQQTLISMQLAEQLNRVTLVKVVGGQTQPVAAAASAAPAVP
jgi:multidrug efflux system outer membrane protein